MATSSIGTETFVSLRNPAGDRGGAPEIEAEEISLFARPGLDGVSIRKDGKKGRPFQMVSFVDVDARADAEAKQTDYRDLVGTVVDLIWNGQNYNTLHGVRYGVLAVHSLRIIKTATAVGGITAGPFVVTAIWELVPVPVAAE